MVQASFLVPHGAESRAYVCFPVDSAAQRSPVLTTLIEFDGVSELPDGLTTADLLAWADLQPERAHAMSVEDLTFALKASMAKTVGFSMYRMMAANDL